jgi:hypothetical protein
VVRKKVVDAFEEGIKQAAEDVVSLGVTCSSLRGMTFTELKAFVYATTTLSTTGCFIKLMWKLTTTKNLRDNGVETIATSVNMSSFFKAYMITFFSENVFEEIREMEIQLVVEASDMVQTFEQFLYGVKNGVDSFEKIVSDAFGLPRKIRDFQERLQIWKIKNKKNNVRCLKDELRVSWQLQNLLDTETGPYWIRTVCALRVRDQKLRRSLLRIDGEDALTVLDTECSMLGKRPRGIDTDVALLGVSRPKTQHHATEVEHGVRSYTMERITHELLLNPDFRIDTDHDLYASQLGIRVRELLRNVFWDSLVYDLSLSEPCNERFLRLLTEFYDDLGTLFRVNTRTNENSRNKLLQLVDICNIFDVGKHATTTQWGSCKFVLGKIWEFVCESFELVCDHKPVRVPVLCNGVRALLQPKTKADPSGYADYVEQWVRLWDALHVRELCLDVRPMLFCNALRFLNDSIRTLRVRVTNERLPSIQLHITRNGVEYERRNFEKKFGKQTEHTDDWIRQSLERETSNGRVAMEDLVLVDTLKSWRYEFIVQAALVHVITDETVPVHAETLLLDLCHVADMQQQVRHCVSMCCKHFGVKIISEDNAIYQIFKRRISSLLLYKPKDTDASFYYNEEHMKRVLHGLQLSGIPDEVVQALCILLGKMHRVLYINIRVHYDRYNAIISRVVEEMRL